MDEIILFFEDVEAGDAEHVRRILGTHPEFVRARDAQHDATPSGWAIHYLRELGGLLATTDATDVDGKPLATYARESGDASIAALFTDTRF